MIEKMAEQQHEIIIPSYAAWYSMTTVHDLEKKALPEFFNSKNKSKTPQVYVEYRDFMVNTYRLNPNEYLTLTACRRNLAGDVCAVMRVHAFLEQWGLINYYVDPDTRPSVMAPPFTGHFRVTADTPRGLQPFLPSICNPPSKPAIQAAYQETFDREIKINMDLRKDIFEAKSLPATVVLKDQKPNQTKIFCFSCGVLCQTRYHSLKVPDVDLCRNCYLQGRFPSTMLSGEFVKLDEQLREEWTEQETLLMLEAIEMYDSDWAAISLHVGTKSRQDCILHFLRLPIEDSYLEEAKGYEPLQQSTFAFTETDGVESVLAHLASSVPKEVAQKITNYASNFEESTLGIAGYRAKNEVDLEFEHMKKLVLKSAELQSKKMDLKIKVFEAMEAQLEMERMELSRLRQNLYEEKLSFFKTIHNKDAVYSLRHDLEPVVMDTSVINI